MRRSPFAARALLVAAAVLAGPVLGPPAAGAAVKPISKPRWVSGFHLTEYYPVPERWFTGARVNTPGMDRRSRVDWLYSARGLSMEGDGIATNGQRVHIADTGSGGWVNSSGRKARFGVGGGFAPFWRTAPSWRTKSGRITFPLARGGWSAGKPKKQLGNPGIRFAPGPSRPLKYLRSVAVDPRLIPLGSFVYLPDYATAADPDAGWMRADDTGGAIKGRRIDVYRRPPASMTDQGASHKHRRIYVVPKKDVAAYLKKHPPRAAILRPALNKALEGW